MKIITIPLVDNQYDITSVALPRKPGQYCLRDKNNNDVITTITRDEDNGLVIASKTKRTLNFFTELTADKLDITTQGDLYFSENCQAKALVLNADNVTLAEQCHFASDSGEIRLKGNFVQLDFSVKTTLKKVTLEAKAVAIENGEFICDAIKGHVDHLVHSNGKLTLNDTNDFDVRSGLLVKEGATLTLNHTKLQCEKVIVHGELTLEDSGLLCDSISTDTSKITVNNSQLEVEQTADFAAGLQASNSKIIADSCYLKSDSQVEQTTIEAHVLRMDGTATLALSAQSSMLAKTVDLQNVTATHSSITATGQLTTHDLQTNDQSVLTAPSIAFHDETRLANMSMDNLAEIITVSGNLTTCQTTLRANNFAQDQASIMKLTDDSRLEVEHEANLLGNVSQKNSHVSANVITIVGRAIVDAPSSLSSYAMHVSGELYSSGKHKTHETTATKGAIFYYDGNDLHCSDRFVNAGQVTLKGQQHLSSKQLQLEPGSLLEAENLTVAVEQCEMQAASQLFVDDELQMTADKLHMKKNAVIDAKQANIDADETLLEQESTVHATTLQLTGNTAKVDGDVRGKKITMGFDQAIYGFSGSIISDEQGKVALYTPVFAYLGDLSCHSYQAVALLDLSLGVQESWRSNKKSLLSVSSVSLPRIPENKRSLLSKLSWQTGVNTLTPYLPESLQAPVSLLSSLWTSGKFLIDSFSHLKKHYEASLKKRGKDADHFRALGEAVKASLGGDDDRTWQLLRNVSATQDSFNSMKQVLQTTEKAYKIILGDDQKKQSSKPTKAEKITQEKMLTTAVEAVKEVVVAEMKAIGSKHSNQSGVIVNASPKIAGTIKDSATLIIVDNGPEAALSIRKEVLHGDYYGFGDSASRDFKLKAQNAIVNNNHSQKASLTVEDKLFLEGDVNFGALHGTAKTVVNHGTTQTGETYFSAGDLHLVSGSFCVGKEKKRNELQSVVKFNAVYRHGKTTLTLKNSLLETGTLLAVRDATLQLDDAHVVADYAFDSGHTELSGDNSIKATNFQHNGKWTKRDGADKANLFVATDKPILYGSAKGLDELAFSFNECSSARGEFMAHGDYHHGNYQAALYALDLPSTFTLDKKIGRDSGVDIRARTIHLNTAVEHNHAVGFSQTEGTFNIHHALAAPEMRLESRNGDMHNHGASIVATHHLDVHVPNGSLLGTARADTYRGKHDIEKNFTPAVFMGGDGAGFDGIGCQIRVGNNLEMQGSDLLSVGDGVVDVGKDISFTPVTHTYVSEYKSKHHNGKSLLQKLNGTCTEALTGKASFYKEHKVTSTKVQNCQVASAFGRFSLNAGGDISSTNTYFGSRFGTTLRAKGNVQLSSLEVKTKRESYERGYHGVNAKKRKQVIRDALGNVMTSNPDGHITIDSAKDVNSVGTEFYGPGASLKVKALGDAYFSRAVTRDSYSERSRGLSMSCIGYDQYQAYRRGGMRAAMSSLDPTVAKFSALAASESAAQYGANAWNAGVNAFNTASGLLGANASGELPNALLERYNLGNAEHGLDPSVTLTYTTSRTKGFQDKLGPGSFAMCDVSMKVGNKLTFDNGFSGDCDNLDLETKNLLMRAADLHRDFSHKSESVSASVSLVSGAVVPGGNFERQSSQATQVENAHFNVRNNARIKADNLTMDGANLTADTLNGTDVKKTKITTRTNKSKSKRVSASIGVSGTSSASGSAQFNRAKERTLTETSGIHVRKDVGADTKLGDVFLKGAGTTSDGLMAADITSVHAKTVKTKSRTFGLGLSGSSDLFSKEKHAKKKAAGQITTVPVSITAKTSKQRAEAVIHGAQGTQVQAANGVHGKLHTKSAHGVKTQDGLNIDVIVDVPTGLSTERISNGLRNMRDGAACVFANQATSPIETTVEQPDTDSSVVSVGSDTEAEERAESQEQQDTVNAVEHDDFLDEADAFIEEMQESLARHEPFMRKLRYQYYLFKCPAADELEFGSEYKKTVYAKHRESAECELKTRGYISDYTLENLHHVMHKQASSELPLNAQEHQTYTELSWQATSQYLITGSVDEHTQKAFSKFILVRLSSSAMPSTNVNGQPFSIDHMPPQAGIAKAFIRGLENGTKELLKECVLLPYDLVMWNFSKTAEERLQAREKDVWEITKWVAKLQKDCFIFKWTGAAKLIGMDIDSVNGAHEAAKSRLLHRARVVKNFWDNSSKDDIAELSGNLLPAILLTKKVSSAALSRLTRGVRYFKQAQRITTRRPIVHFGKSGRKTLQPYLVNDMPFYATSGEAPYINSMLENMASGKMGPKIQKAFYDVRQLARENVLMGKGDLCLTDVSSPLANPMMSLKGLPSVEKSVKATSATSTAAASNYAKARKVNLSDPGKCEQVRQALTITEHELHKKPLTIHHGTGRKHVTNILDKGPKNIGGGMGGSGLYASESIEAANHYGFKYADDEAVIMQGVIRPNESYRIAKIRLVKSRSQVDIEKGLFHNSWSEDKALHQFMLDNFDIIEVEYDAMLGSIDRIFVIHENAAHAVHTNPIDWEKLRKPIQFYKSSIEERLAHKFPMLSTLKTKTYPGLFGKSHPSTTPKPPRPLNGRVEKIFPARSDQSQILESELAPRFFRAVAEAEPCNPEGIPKFNHDMPAHPNGSAGAARAWTKKARIKQAQLPNKGKFRYIPDESYYPSMPLPRGKNKGYIDKFGNEWVKGSSRTPGEPFEWDVLLSPLGKKQMGSLIRPGKTHLNISLEGRLTHR